MTNRRAKWASRRGEKQSLEGEANRSRPKFQETVLGEFAESGAQFHVVALKIGSTLGL